MRWVKLVSGSPFTVPALFSTLRFSLYHLQRTTSTRFLPAMDSGRMRKPILLALLLLFICYAPPPPPKNVLLSPLISLRAPERVLSFIEGAGNVCVSPPFICTDWTRGWGFGIALEWKGLAWEKKVLVQPCYISLY